MAERPAPGWSPWQPLSTALRYSPAVLRELLDGGQAFRWNQESTGDWLGWFDAQIVRLRLDETGGLLWAAPVDLASVTEPAVLHYLGLDSASAAAVDALPWRSDRHLARCLAEFPGLGILRQPFGDTLLGFLCSATKQIVQIKQMIALLAERHGAPLATSARAATGGRFHRLPTWGELARVPENELRACLLGFRAKYIHQTAVFLAAHPGWLEETARAPYFEAKERLCSLSGVGEKVADCVLLFGAARLEAFPVDVWIIKAMARRYGLEDWKPGQIAHFGRVHFGAFAGLAQQYLFAYERKHGRASH